MVIALRGPDGRSLSGALRAEGGSCNPLSAAARRMLAPVVLAGCGYWTQQERPAEVNAELLDFLAGVDDTEIG